MSRVSLAQAFAARMAAVGGGSVRAILFYGSQLHEAAPGRDSALDLVVVVEDYRSFYRAVAAARELHRAPWIMAALARVLPPNTMAFAPGGGADGIAKCMVVSTEHLAVALGDAPPDHFLLGRLVQRTAIVWARSGDDRAWVEARLAGARAGILRWMLAYLDAPVDAAGLGRRLLEVCYAGEVRPEARDRAHRLFDAQLEHFREAFQPVLEAGVDNGILVEENGLYRPVSAPSEALRRRWRRYFRRSKYRATLRWFKHTLTFANWLPYIVQKVERHTGQTIELTRLEKALPIAFLWPRAIRVLLTRPSRRVGS